MSKTIADRLSSIHKAERKVAALAPHTAAWSDAQRVAVSVRADYWEAMRREWDRNHGPQAERDLSEWLY